MSIADRIRSIRATLPEGVELVAVSKFHPVEQILEAYEAGQRSFGESRIQELTEKAPQLPADVNWHFIGHLQTNKVRRLVGHATLIESIDSERLLELVDSESERAGVTSRVLLQVHVAQEETKFGFSPEELLDYFGARRFEKLRATHLCGLMAMASNTDDAERVREDFRRVAELRRRILELAPDLRGFDILSMGMSDDYRTAIEEGSTHVRIGTAIFGERAAAQNPEIQNQSK
ncbi:MAG: YggS family pyridoxal phosphate-dependent enzyme [Muribaculaceae bacterium]|nr:YggS family pyridoxal phosphate-dependent enzyme [Muribaculaceae bacterium]